ncbi:hypothetical protein CPT_Sonora_072 [Stenotrophomonas phage Sonora]|nr:hypothetical protein CPT_Sonora_072 [Stenotrophomonas phage Sonora]
MSGRRGVPNMVGDQLVPSMREDRDEPARKPVHSSSAICATPDGFLVRTHIVLCSDGSIWRLSDTDPGIDRWVQLPSIPNT